MGHRLLVVTGGDETLQALPGQLGDDLDIVLVESANEALWEVRSAPPQAILANLTLPDMSGLDLADILPNFGASTRIVLWSSEEDADARRDAETQGVYRYVSGTLAIDELSAILHEAVLLAQAEEPMVEEMPEPEPAPSVPEPTPQPETSAPRVVERIERQSSTADPSPADARPARRIVPNPDPPYQPPGRSSPAATASSEARPGRRSVPNPDPPYQPPERSSASSSPSSRRGSPNPDPPYQPPDNRRTFTNRLTSRTRAAQTTPAPVPEPAPVESPPPHPRRTGTLVVTKDNLAETQTILSDLWQNLSAQCALLTDRAGMVLAQHGETKGLPVMMLLPLLSTSFSTAGEVARQLGEEDAMTLYMHDGARYNLYCFDIAQRFLLVVVFDKNIAATRIGSVWVEARSAIRKLTNALK